MRLKTGQDWAKALFLGIVVACSAAFAAEVRGLQDIYATPIPAEIRRNFDRTIHIHQTCPECHVAALDGEKFFNIYSKKFLVVGVTPNSFGGVWAIIAVEGEPTNAFRLWLYDIGQDEYELRSMEKLPKSLRKELIQQLSSEAYQHYWL